jgi:crotonobetainyl-CoA:carnitine CoA-transferase CaiB-like acyl-CoA transferase
MLAGVRVLDLSRLLPGPACTWMLQGLGAKVDRIEAPAMGDFTRHIPPFVEGVGGYFAAVSRGKRSITIDLRSEGAAALIRRLLGHYDVFVESFKPEVLEEMRLDPVDLVTEQPELIVARLSGFGQTGPWSDRPGHDITYMGLTGALAAGTHTIDGPAIPAIQVADLSGALTAAMGICAALFDRERTGSGRILDVSLTESALSFMAPHIVPWSTEGREPAPGGEILSGGFPLYGTYRCADGKWLTVGAVEPKFQNAVSAALGGAAGREDLARAFATRPRDAWVDLLGQACVAPVLGIGELADHPQLAERGAVERLGRTTWIRPPLADHVVEGDVPSLGQHTDEILEDVGIPADERAALRASGVLGQMR